MSIRHHVDEDLNWAYAAGELPEAVALFVASHAALCTRCDATIRSFEALGGDSLEGISPVATRSGAAERALERVDASVRLAVEEPVPLEETDDELPEPLRRYLGAGLSSASWRLRLPGIREILLPVSLGGVAVRIFRLSTSLRLPLHTHAAPEYTLILSGGMRDEHGVYERGDVHVYDARHRHRQRVLPGEPCICLVVNSEPLVPVTLIGRLFGLLDRS